MDQTIRLDDSNLSLNNFKEEDRAVIQGLAEGEINAVLGYKNVKNENIADYAVTPSNTTFFDAVPIVNLFDINSAKIGYGMSTTSGEEFPNADWMISQHIPVDGATEYEFSHICRFVEFDVEGNYLNGETDVKEMTTSGTTKTIRVMIPIAATDFTVTIKDYPIIKDQYINKDVTLDNFKGDLKFKRLGNLYLDDTSIKNTAVNTLGDMVASAYYDLIPKISVNSGDVYIITKPRGQFAVFFDTNDAFSGYVSAADDGVEQTFVVPVDGYMSVNVFKEYASEFQLAKRGESDGFKLERLKVDKDNASGELLSLIEKVAGNFKGKRIVAFGDSITWYDGKLYLASHLDSGKLAVGYINYLRTQLGASVVNQGVSGNTMSNILSRIKSFVFEENQIVTISAGANDWSQEIPVGSLSLPEATFVESEFYGALQSAVEHILNLNLGIEIVLVTPIRGYHPVSTHNGLWKTYGRIVGEIIEQPDFYAKAFKEVAELYGLKIVDFRDGIGLNFLNYKELLRDNPDMTNGKYVHPGNELHDVMGHFIVKEFEKLAL